jgi:hypothetical protein
MSYLRNISREEMTYNLKEVINDFINLQEKQDNNDKPKTSIKTSFKRAISIRNIINVLRLTPFKTLKTFWCNISLYCHKNRNINQMYREPDDLEKMEMLEDMGLFKLLGKTGPTKGHTGAHNISQDDKGLLGRWNNFLTLDGHGENLDYRGVTGSCFEGVQCIYNENTGKLVTADLNKGTFDYCHPAKNNFHHFIYDVLPWVAWSNCGDDPIRKQSIPRSTWKQIEIVWNNFSRNEATKSEAQLQVNDIINKNHPITNKVNLTFNANDRPDFDELEAKETRSSESYYNISILNNDNIKIPANICNVDYILKLLSF